MSSSARLMPPSSSAANPDLARQSPIYALDPSSSSKSHGSMLDDLIRNMYESSETGGDPKGCGGGGKTVEEVWKEISGREMDGGDGSGFNGEITLEEYLNKEEVRVPVGFGMDSAVMSQHQGQMAVESQNQVLGIGNGVESGGRGRGRKRPVLDPVDRAAMQRQKRMIKNRESAARSRERKQAYTVELESLVTQLEEENARLVREQEELHRQRLKQTAALGSTEQKCSIEVLMENLIPVTERKKPPRSLRRTQTMQW